MQAKRAQDEGGHWSPCMTPRPVHARRAAELARGRPGHVTAAESKAKRCDAPHAPCAAAVRRGELAAARPSWSDRVHLRETSANQAKPAASCRVHWRSIHSIDAARETSRLSRLRVFVSRDGPLASSRKNRVCSRSDWHGSLFCRCPAPTRRKHTPRHMHTFMQAAQPTHARFAAAPAYRTEQSASDEHQTRHAAQRE